MTSPQHPGPGAEESFRDSLGIVSQEGKRRWLFPKAPRGRFHNARIAMSAVLLLILFGVPFIRIGGHPFFLFNVLERKLILFGTLFGPHDFYLVGLSAITAHHLHHSLHGGIRTPVLRLGLSANGVHGDGLPEDRLLCGRGPPGTSTSRRLTLEREEILPQIGEICDLRSPVVPHREHAPRLHRGRG